MPERSVVFVQRLPDLQLATGVPMDQIATTIDLAAPFSRERLAGYRPEMLESRLLLLGAGALGASIAIQLSMWGFRSATIVDFDTFDMSNATRVLDFPFGSIRRGATVGKAKHLAARWRQRLRETSVKGIEIRAIEGYAQELPPHLWREADVIIGAVDHPRARFDCARLARRYGKPFISGGFDGQSGAITLRYFPASPKAACIRCTSATVPEYAATGASCQAAGLRALEARKLPATPSLAGVCGSWMVQRLVDLLTFGATPDAERLEARIRRGHGVSQAESSIVPPDPQCVEHEPEATVELDARGAKLGRYLRALHEHGPEHAMVPIAPFAVHVVDRDHLQIARVPAWRLKAGRRLHDSEPPPDAYPLVLEELTYPLAKQLGLLGLPAAWFGLGPGAIIELRGSERRTMAVIRA